MRITEKLKPKKVFEYFEDICKIPHGSGNTFAISQYCVDFAKNHNLEVKRDSLNNVIIKKTASVGYETHPAVIIQGHLDMVCEKEANCNIDFNTDGLVLEISDGYLQAKGTTLGGDDGIAVAMALAVLDDDTLLHPDIYAVFTVDEETGMFGAEYIDLKDVNSKILLNIDSEKESILTVSCAGGVRCDANILLDQTDTFGNCFEITVLGLIGGHSGVEIHCNRLNANKVMAGLLGYLYDNFKIAICSVSGGNKDNAIPRECTAVICTNSDQYQINKLCEDYLNTICTDNDPDIKITVTNSSAQYATDTNSTEKVIGYLKQVPNGVIKMSDDIDGLVETSLNLGILLVESSKLSAGFSLRSSVNSQKEQLIKDLSDITLRYNGTIVSRNSYPAWEYKKNSRLRDVMVDVHTRLYGTTPVVEAIHAGLECGLLCDKIEGLDAVSFGPNILDIHTPRERLDIKSTERTYNYLIEVLKEL